MSRELFLYDTLSKDLQKFVPADGHTVKIYICGPTVYDSPHIGHARTYISFDIIRRVLRDYFGYDVTLVMNITNIDDKIIKRAAERNISCDELSRIYEEEFFEQMDGLHVQRPDFTTRVTEYVCEIVRFIEKLVENGIAYESNGSVYFSIQEYKKKFSYNLLRPETCREEEDECVEKKTREDFVLWKASKPGEPTYASSWGPGRPGWHIECSVMATEILGDRLDIHAGGIDLAFPHHENEIAQCQGYFGKEWGRYFMHTGHLNINGLKMSKSLKNFKTIKEIVANSSAQQLRVLFLQHQWNKDMNYEVDQLKEAGAILKRLHNFVSNAESRAAKSSFRSICMEDRKILAELEAAKGEIDTALRNNINTARVLDVMQGLIYTVNQQMKTVHSDVLQLVLGYVKRMMSLFGLLVEKRVDGDSEKVAGLLNEFRSSVRKVLKSKGDSKMLYGFCDQIRESLKECGYAIDDGAEESVIRRIIEN